MIDELSLLYRRVIHQIGAVKTQPVRKFYSKYYFLSTCNKRYWKPVIPKHSFQSHL